MERQSPHPPFPTNVEIIQGSFKHIKDMIK
jgi:hypothetical protein